MERFARDCSRVSSNCLTRLESALIFSCRNSVFVRVNLWDQKAMSGLCRAQIQMLGRERVARLSVATGSMPLAKPTEQGSGRGDWERLTVKQAEQRKKVELSIAAVGKNILS